MKKIMLAMMIVLPFSAHAQQSCPPDSQAYHDHGWHHGCLDADQMNQALADGNISSFPIQELREHYAVELQCPVQNFHDGQFHPGCMDLDDLQAAGVDITK